MKIVAHKCAYFCPTGRETAYMSSVKRISSELRAKGALLIDNYVAT